MFKKIFKSPPDEEGQGLVEYALILVLVAVVAIAVLLILGPSVGNVFSKVVAVLEFAQGGGSGVITGISTSSAGSNRLVNVSVSQSTTVSISLTAGSGTIVDSSKTCDPSCTFNIQSASPNGTVSATAAAGGQASSSW